MRFTRMHDMMINVYVVLNSSCALQQLYRIALEFYQQFTLINGLNFESIQQKKIKEDDKMKGISMRKIIIEIITKEWCILMCVQWWKMCNDLRILDMVFAIRLSNSRTQLIIICIHKLWEIISKQKKTTRRSSTTTTTISISTSKLIKGVQSRWKLVKWIKKKVLVSSTAPATVHVHKF